MEWSGVQLCVPFAAGVPVPVAVGFRVSRDRACCVSTQNWQNRRSAACYRGRSLTALSRTCCCGKSSIMRQPCASTRSSWPIRSTRRRSSRQCWRAPSGACISRPRISTFCAEVLPADAALLSLAQGVSRSRRRPADRHHSARRVGARRLSKVRRADEHARCAGRSGRATARHQYAAAVQRLRSASRRSRAAARPRRLQLGRRHGQHHLRRRPAVPGWAVPRGRLSASRGGRVRATRSACPGRARGQVLGRTRGRLLGPVRLRGAPRAHADLQQPVSAGAGVARSADGAAAGRGAPAQRARVLAAVPGAERGRDGVELRPRVPHQGDLARPDVGERQLLPVLGAARRTGIEMSPRSLPNARCRWLASAGCASSSIRTPPRVMARSTSAGPRWC